LDGKEEALGPKHTSTLDTVNNLGLLYFTQDKLAEAMVMYMRALEGREEALGPKHTSTLDTVNNLGILYFKQGKFAEAGAMYVQALEGYKKALGEEQVRTHLPALKTMWNMGILSAKLLQKEKAVEMFYKALSGFAIIQGADSRVCQDIRSRLKELEDRREEKGDHEPTGRRTLSRSRLVTAFMKKLM
jgi:Tfp pilus assembly protein PilF